MRFQVLSQNNTPLMSTTSIECIPTSEELLSMDNMGYKFKIDGKLLSRKKIVEHKEKIHEENCKIKCSNGHI